MGGHSERSDWQVEVLETLRALGGEATLGDVVAVTGLFRTEVLHAFDALLATEAVHVRVSESGDVVYHIDIDGRRTKSQGPAAPWSGRSPRAAELPFDRKTLRLIRAREGVLSLAELVEHTGLPLIEAEREMARLAERYGGEPHPSWDGHVVWAFPELMSSAYGRFDAREPRPAWVRAEEPGRAARSARFGPLARAVAAVLRHPWVRFRSPRTLRRYALGHVIQTALAGKGVVSLGGTVRYLQARAGRTRVPPAAVEAALRRLASEFDAPVTEVEGELFFGFRNVKRQFLASQVVRRRIRLGHVASGDTVFDTADSPELAGARELAAFDRDLFSAPDGAEKRHDAAKRAE